MSGGHHQKGEVYVHVDVRFVKAWPQSRPRVRKLADRDRSGPGRPGWIVEDEHGYRLWYSDLDFAKTFRRAPERFR